jgi:hypothetical protein
MIKVGDFRMIIDKRWTIMVPTCPRGSDNRPIGKGAASRRPDYNAAGEPKKTQ